MASSRNTDHWSNNLVAPTSDPYHWSKNLVADMSDPEAVVFEDEELCVIKDKYPKARIHLLVLPKDERLNSIQNLDRGHAPLVRRMEAAGRMAVQKRFPPTEIRIGFHAVPSMARLHLHVISQDFDSEYLRYNKHWNAFNTPHFVDVSDVISQLEESGKVNAINSTKQRDQWLHSEMKCHKCDFKSYGMRDLKTHLRSHQHLLPRHF